jgi:hypothetical protein
MVCTHIKVTTDGRFIYLHTVHGNVMSESVEVEYTYNGEQYTTYSALNDWVSILDES